MSIQEKEQILLKHHIVFGRDRKIDQLHINMGYRILYDNYGEPILSKCVLTGKRRNISKHNKERLHGQFFDEFGHTGYFYYGGLENPGFITPFDSF